MQQISSKEDAMAKLFGLYTDVEGIKGVQPCGVPKKQTNESFEMENLNDSSIQNTFLDEQLDEVVELKRKVRRVESTQHSLHDFMQN